TDYTPARLYHPETGRFTTRDPHPTPLNKYQAFNANPINGLDPTGNITLRILRNPAGSHIDDPETYTAGGLPGGSRAAARNAPEIGGRVLHERPLPASEVTTESAQPAITSRMPPLRPVGETRFQQEGVHFYAKFGMEYSVFRKKYVAVKDEFHLAIGGDHRSEEVMKANRALLQLDFLSLLSAALEVRVKASEIFLIAETAKKFRNSVRELQRSYEEHGNEKPEWFRSLNIMAGSGVIRSMERIKKEDFYGLVEDDAL
ncbi:RHS repeat-associated core domain-containing protein, partial [Streptomyces sp. NRRL F-2664]|uniref:RHS repeat-associated core domain-containing protein n=1 Tax=Streptomyces sp. NRRL F-2664 TaxID=1463842 RepID=UPI002D219F48